MDSEILFILILFGAFLAVPYLPSGLLRRRDVADQQVRTYRPGGR